MELEEIENNIKKTIATVCEMKRNGAFDNYITRIRFPFFKHFTFHSEINFKVPLTILSGKNGSGKSSALHALYGAPKGKNISDFWFSSQLDPIEDFGGDIQERHCYFYDYICNKKEHTVLYHRIYHKNRDSMEYWETSRPRAKYHMDTSKQRSNPIEKECVYIDFRKELSAFDKFFYFGDMKNLKSKSKQDYLRLKSAELKNIIETEKINSIRGVPQNERPIQLTEQEVQEIGFILQEDYEDIKIIEHKLFQGWGTSVIWKKKGYSYSEAHAGSGEIAIVILVHTILSAQANSLILLDEPEVSLHPGAQKRLLLFLLEQIKVKKHQIVMSTHSPVFTEEMPKEAIKRFFRNPDTNKIDILDECYPSEAFKYLGSSSKYDNARIHVEDELAKKILLSVIKNNPNQISNFKVVYTPGGASYIKRNLIVNYAQLNNNKNFVLLDGDQRYAERIVDLDRLTVGEAKDPAFFKNEIWKFTRENIHFPQDGGNGGRRVDQVIEAQKKYIRFCERCVRFLPKNTPEEIIWDEEHVSELVRIQSPSFLSEILTESNYKCKISKTALALTGNTASGSIHFVEDMLIKKWIEKNDESQREIRDILQEFMGIVNGQQLVVR
ncbi:ATP-binding protein [Paenibacillus dendritiformis]|uniref:ATP-dependent nuclease n=1 Tax=Paenibacillus dendritiformis TaxID=130049 RepID=UPI00143DBE82|nr:AAA family ATPase [Paenibacillus dendritiformis]NKI23241.1 ATP-binding protein [Paenibacillus dendritiformis]NRF98038.1 ATP-binding protein [Paenibacillus dendritiformis]